MTNEFLDKTAKAQQQQQQQNKKLNITRKSKTEAVLQRRSMFKLGVICKFMKRYGKCFMS